jgi:hypothetical protein
MPEFKLSMIPVYPVPYLATIPAVLTNQTHLTFVTFSLCATSITVIQFQLPK